ncbi:MAG: hypothetical protein ABR507_06030 [Actinomycetota bacterium]|nr:hypothetical protein [Actinomycetota bacterium]
MSRIRRLGVLMILILGTISILIPAASAASVVSQCSGLAPLDKSCAGQSFALALNNQALISVGAEFTGTISLEIKKDSTNYWRYFCTFVSQVSRSCSSSTSGSLFVGDVVSLTGTVYPYFVSQSSAIGAWQVSVSQ